jgi:streptogramin lyase
MMRSIALAMILAVAPMGGLRAQDATSQSDIPVLNYKLVPDWPKTLPGDKGVPSSSWNYWQVPSVAVEANGNILVLHRGDDPILEYKPNGDFIGRWGDVTFSQGKVAAIFPKDRMAAMSGYQATYGPGGCSNCGAHEIRVDPDGNVWVVDAPGQIIIKMNPQGHTVMTLGIRGKAGMTQNTFNLPTDVAFAPNGEIVVSDGYSNARVVRFSHDGKYLGEFGERGNGPAQFQLPHNVVIDRQGRLYVADRENQRVEVFDSRGKFLSEWNQVGSLSSLIMTRDQRVWAGGVLRDLHGKALGKLPGEGANARAHGAAIAPNGDIYFGLLSGVVEKFTAQ